MVEIEDMAPKEMHALLQRVGYGHLGCTRDGHPYVVPIHYAYEEPDIYIYTTEGLKTNYIGANPEVCLQVEEVHDPSHWRSIVVVGRAQRLTHSEDIEQAMRFIKERNPTLTP